jgi:hypothetical protein
LWWNQAFLFLLNGTAVKYYIKENLTLYSFQDDAAQAYEFITGFEANNR